jgi:hypothetical protein
MPVPVKTKVCDHKPLGTTEPVLWVCSSMRFPLASRSCTATSAECAFDVSVFLKVRGTSTLLAPLGLSLKDCIAKLVPSKVLCHRPSLSVIEFMVRAVATDTGRATTRARARASQSGTLRFKTLRFDVGLEGLEALGLF